MYILEGLKISIKIDLLFFQKKFFYCIFCRDKQVRETRYYEDHQHRLRMDRDQCKLINLHLLLVIRDSQVLAKLGVVTIFFIGWGQTARLQRVRQNTADRIQTETEQQQTARLQRVRQNTADRILKFDKRYKAFEIAGYFQKHRELIG